MLLGIMPMVRSVIAQLSLRKLDYYTSPIGITVYKKNKADKNYQSVTDMGIVFARDDEFRYDPATRKLIRKTNSPRQAAKELRKYIGWWMESFYGANKRCSFTD